MPLDWIMGIAVTAFTFYSGYKCGHAAGQMDAFLSFRKSLTQLVDWVMFDDLMLTRSIGIENEWKVKRDDEILFMGTFDEAVGFIDGYRDRRSVIK
jgi:hypothetical protein